MSASINLLDPRIVRTRQLLRQTLIDLLGEKGFDDISVQDIADRSTVNRATFYDHYVDKYALMEDVVGEHFNEMLSGREVAAASACPDALKRLILAVCDFLAELEKRCSRHDRHLDTLVESKVKSVVREILLLGLRKKAKKTKVSLELSATVASWAIYGAAIEWIRSGKSKSAETFTEVALPLIRGSLNMACVD